MARLAEQLGRKFEARVFLTVAISDEPERDDLRQDLQRLMSQRSKRAAWRGRTLAEVIEHEDWTNAVPRESAGEHRGGPASSAQTGSTRESASSSNSGCT